MKNINRVIQILLHQSKKKYIKVVDNSICKFEKNLKKTIVYAFIFYKIVQFKSW